MENFEQSDHVLALAESILTLDESSLAELQTVLIKSKSLAVPKKPGLPVKQDTKFKLGQSGNPKGRPRKSNLNISDMIAEALTEKIPSPFGGKYKITKLEYLIKLKVFESGKGDHKAFKMLIDLCKMFGSPGLKTDHKLAKLLGKSIY